MLDVNSQPVAYLIGAALRLAKAIGLLTDALVVAAGTLQTMTLTVIGSVGGSGAGNITVTVTAANSVALASGKAIVVAVANSDTATQIATKIKTAMDADTDVTAFFTVSRSGAILTFEAKTSAAPDATMNAGYALTTATGPTAVPTATQTVAGLNGVTGLRAAFLAAPLPQGSDPYMREKLDKAVRDGYDLGLWTATSITNLTTADGLIALTGVPDNHSGESYY